MSKLPSLNNQSKSNKESTINDDKISNSKSPEGNSSYLQFNESTDNDNTDLQTELKLPTDRKSVV